MTNDDRGEKVVTVAREAMTHALFRDGPARTVELPDDVEIVELWHTPYGEGYQMRLSSTEWEPTPEGAELDHINPTIHETWPEPKKPDLEEFGGN